MLKILKQLNECSITTSHVTEINCPWLEENKFAIFIEGICSQKECDILIDYSENTIGYEQAPLNVGGGKSLVDTDVRFSDRCLIKNLDMVEIFWQRIISCLENKRPDLLEKLLRAPWENKSSLYAVGLNEQMRYLKYNPQNYFAPHTDGSFVRSDEAGIDRIGETSYVTCLLYLNEGFVGGETGFLSYDDQQRINIIPKTGSVLLFQHKMRHEGCLLKEGIKYTIRTDVMYNDSINSSELTYAKKRFRMKGDVPLSAPASPI